MEQPTPQELESSQQVINGDQFIQQQAAPTIPSKQGDEAEAQPQPAGPAGGHRYAPPPPPPGYVPPTGAKPMFEGAESESGDQPQPEPAGAASSKYTKDYKQSVVRGFINSEDFFTAMLCGAIADAPASEFRAGEEEKEALLQSMEPYIDWIVEKCPTWIPLLATYGMIKGQQALKVVKMVKENKKREAAAKQPSTYQPLKQKAAAEPAKGVRKNFKLHKSGQHYYNDRDGQYVKATDEKERPSIDDLAAICNGGNSIEVIMKAFPQLSREQIENLQDE